MNFPDLTSAEQRLKSWAESIRPPGNGRAVATVPGEIEVDTLAANDLFDAVSAVDTLWHASVFEGDVPYDEAGSQRVADLYRSWADSADHLLARLEALPDRGRGIPGADRLRANRDEARGIATPDDEFFDDQALRARQDEALDAFRRGETVEFEEFGD